MKTKYLLLIFEFLFVLFEIVYGISLLIQVNPQERSYSLDYLQENVFYIPNSDSRGKYEIVIYNLLMHEVFSLRFNDTLTLIIPYDLERFSYAEVYERYYKIFDFSLELCNYNDICEDFEYNCKDCVAKEITPKSVDKNKKNLYIYVIINYLILFVVGLFLSFFYFRFIKKRK
ncbi:MAG: hypothetical protein QXD62_03475 [Candidatus Woesearchaeota archaeon]